MPKIQTVLKTRNKNLAQVDEPDSVTINALYDGIKNTTEVRSNYMLRWSVYMHEN